LWNDRLRIAESAKSGWDGLDEAGREIARTALEKLDEDPIIGSPLFAPFRGIWSYRLGEMRILYRIAPEAGTVFVLRIERVSETES
jgi:mRNA-degrading endonuclease RelE of RelBE toxin-antitoxin system